MAFNGHIDEANRFSLRGWVHSDTFPSLSPFVDIVVNRRFITRVPAKDRFSFNPFEALSPGLNLVELFFAGSDQLLENGTHYISGDLPESAPSAREAAGPFDAFLDEVELLAAPELAGKILAMSGSLAKAVSDRGHACEPEKLEAAEFDLVLAAHSCEHWFPSIADKLEDIFKSLRPGGMACLDFACEDAGLTISRGVYESGGGTFYRVYSETELRIFFLEAGLEIMDIVLYDILLDEKKRALVGARKPEVME